jgi:hypothetical protein
MDKKMLIADSEYPFEHGEDINYTLDGVSMHPVSTKILESFLTYHEANGDFKPVTELNGCDRFNLRMDQQRCS